MGVYPAMKLGIVGSESAKFTHETEALARQAIRRLFIGLDYQDLVISGRSPLGGIDIWAVEEARQLGIPTKEFPPATFSWETGYKPRNLQIARESDKVVCITVKTLPPTYRGMRFDRGCYHCGTPPDHHIKSGGCYTMWQAVNSGKEGELIVIGNEVVRLRLRSDRDEVIRARTQQARREAMDALEQGPDGMPKLPSEDRMQARSKLSGGQARLDL